MVQGLRGASAESDAAKLDHLSDCLLSGWSRDALHDALFDFLVPEFCAGALLRTFPRDPRVSSTRSRGVLTGRTRNFGLSRRDWSASLDLFEPAERPALEIGIERACEALARAFEFQRDHRVAITFQEQALSTQLPISALYLVDAVYAASGVETQIGGDWYDAFALPDGRLVLSVGDVVGSGLTAAITMFHVRQAIRGAAHVHAHPEVILGAASMSLRTQFPDTFVTAFIVVLDPITGYCLYAGAGHPPALVRDRAGRVTELHSQALPLGVSDRPDAYDSDKTMLDEGSTLLLYTDGAIEYGRDVIEGSRCLQQAFSDLDVTTTEPARHLYRSVVPGQADDDVAMLLIDLHTLGRVHRWRFDPMWPDAMRRVRGELAGLLAQHGFGDRDIPVFEMLFAELCSNALAYAPGTIEVYLEYRNESVVIHVIDNGPGFEFRPRLPHDLFSERGRGLFLLSKLAHDFSVEPSGKRGSHARLALRPSTKELLQ